MTEIETGERGSGCERMKRRAGSRHARVKLKEEDGCPGKPAHPPRLGAPHFPQKRMTASPSPAGGNAWPHEAQKGDRDGMDAGAPSARPSSSPMRWAAGAGADTGTAYTATTG